jgi:microsomal prostaglandin-E synthase 2
VEVNPLTKSEISWSAYRKVPIVMANGVVLTDSSSIMDGLEVALAASSAPRPLGAARGAPLTPIGDGAPSEAAWRAWCDEVLIPHLTVNIYRNLGEALATFDYLTQRNFPSYSAAPVKWVGAVAMLAVARARRAKLGLAGGGDERAALVRVLDDFAAAVAAGAAGGPFLGGAAPNLADVSAFGALRAIKGLATHAEALQASPRARAWYEAMEARVGGSALTARVGEAPPPSPPPLA